MITVNRPSTTSLWGDTGERPTSVISASSPRRRGSLRRPLVWVPATAPLPSGGCCADVLDARHAAHVRDAPSGLFHCVREKPCLLFAEPHSRQRRHSVSCTGPLLRRCSHSANATAAATAAALDTTATATTPRDSIGRERPRELNTRFRTTGPLSPQCDPVLELLQLSLGHELNSSSQLLLLNTAGASSCTCLVTAVATSCSWPQLSTAALAGHQSHVLSRSQLSRLDARLNSREVSVQVTVQTKGSLAFPNGVGQIKRRTVMGAAQEKDNPPSCLNLNLNINRDGKGE
jgi:hypothetical protein